MKDDKATTRFLQEVGKYAVSIGGKVLVAGPIKIQVWPGEDEHRFTVAVECFGHRPPREKK